MKSVYKYILWQLYFILESVIDSLIKYICHKVIVITSEIENSLRYLSQRLLHGIGDM